MLRTIQLWLRAFRSCAPHRSEHAFDAWTRIAESPAIVAQHLSTVYPEFSLANKSILEHTKLSNQDGFDEAFKALLENSDFMADGGILGFGLRHGYIIEHRSLGRLCDVVKGSDAVVYNSMCALGLEPALHMYYDKG